MFQMGNRRTANVRSKGYSDLFSLNKGTIWNWINIRTNLAPPPQSPWTTFGSDSSQSCNIRQKMRKDEYIKECMVWKSEKGILGKVKFYEMPCIFFLNFQYLRKKYVIRVAGNVSSSIFFFIYFFPEILKIKKIYTGFFIKCDFSQNTFFRIFKPCIP